MPFDPTYEIDDDTISIGDLVRVPGSGSDFIKDGETGTVIALGSPPTRPCKRVTRATTWAIGPMTALLVISGWHAHGGVRQVASGTVAALVGMVPQGLVLLTSVAFGVAAITLSRRRVLVQQLPAVEGLARVDVVCLDKTGTLTDGTIAFDSLIRLDDTAPAGAALGALADAYFAAQGVALKVISGDSPLTVSAVAVRAGLPGADRPVEARDLPQDPAALGRLLEERSVFGRVTPQRKQAMVTALQARGHTVAMTGDGVNDVLALKLADIGIAMGSGAPATRAVAELVLLDSRFATLPGIVAEGRRVTANIERVSNLFITKTAWTTFLAVAVGVTLLPYPFLPRHLTIIDSLSIAVPSFFLALAPNTRRYVPGFTGRVLRFAIPAGAIIAAATFAAYALARAEGLPLIQQRTTAALVALILSVCVLVMVAAPLTWRRILLIGSVLAGFGLLFPVPAVRRFSELQLPRSGLPATLAVAALGAAALACFWVLSRRRGRGQQPG